MEQSAKTKARVLFAVALFAAIAILYTTSDHQHIPDTTSVHGKRANLQQQAQPPPEAESLLRARAAVSVPMVSADSCSLLDLLPLDTETEIVATILQRLAKEHEWFSANNAVSSIHNIELMSIAALLHVIRPAVLFESGVYQGRSTAFFSAYADAHIRGKVEVFKQISVCFPHCPEHLRSLAHDSLKLIEGDSSQIVKELDPNASTVAIVDGPKAAKSGGVGEDLMFASLLDQLVRFKNVSYIFMHDMRRQIGGHNLNRFFEYYVESGLSRSHKLCLMSEDVLRRFSSHPTLGAVQRDEKEFLGHVGQSAKAGWGLTAWLVKDKFFDPLGPIIPAHEFNGKRTKAKIQYRDSHQSAGRCHSCPMVSKRRSTTGPLRKHAAPLREITALMMISWGRLFTVV